MQLPRADRAFVHPDKVGAYLLVLEHPQGQSKAHAFVKAGFSLGSSRMLADQLRRLARSGVARNGSHSIYGQKYEIDGMIQSPSGDTGAIVHLHSPDAFEVEFMRSSGTTVAVIELTAADVRLARDDDQMAVRSHAEMTGRE